MSSQRAFFKIILTVVAIVLMLHVSFSIISTSTAAAAEQTETQETETAELTRETEIALLTQQIETLNQLIEELSGNQQFILVLRIEQEILGTATLQSTVLQIPVDKGFFDSCAIGEDITDSSQIRLLSSSLLAETKVYVEDKYTISR